MDRQEIFSRKDRIKNIRLPTQMTPELAYFIGLLIGDGFLSNGGNNNKGYRVSIAGHAYDELVWHKEKTIPLLRNLFNIYPKIRICKGKRGCWMEIYFYSKAIVLFLHRTLEMSYSPKKNLKIPEVIKQGTRKIQKNFLRGLADTEFCLTFKKRHKQIHYYPVIEYGTSDKSLARDVLWLLTELGIRTTSSFGVLARRENKVHITHQIHINGVERIEKWMREIGFTSEKHLSKYRVWKLKGSCPPKTNLQERIEMLSKDVR